MGTVSNAELAAVFREVGAVLQYQGESWHKIRAYLAWADTLDTLDRPAVDLSDAELQAMPGVGKAIFSKTRDYAAKGTFNLLDRVRLVSPEIRALLAAGLSPGAMRALEDTLGITDQATLLAAHRAGTLETAKIPARQRNELLAFLRAAAS